MPVSKQVSKRPVPPQKVAAVNKTVPNKKVQKRPKAKKRFLPGQWLLIWFGLTFVAVISATAGALLAVSLSSTPLKQKTLTAKEAAVFSEEETISRKSLRLPELTRPVNILVLGTKVLTSDVDNPPKTDVGYHALVDSFEGLSDTMLLLRFDPNNQKFTVLSIPRDTKTYIEGHGVTKINAANSFGGPALAAQTVSNLLGEVPIDRYVRVNVQGIEKLIDALGGVSVYVPQDMKYTDESQHLFIDLKKGQQLLDGNKALQFLRFRYDEFGDIGRVQRQQMLMRAIVEQSLNPKVLVKIPDILTVIQSHIDTNLSVEELVALAGFAAQQKRSDVQMLMLPGDFGFDQEKKISYWIPFKRQIEALAAQYFDQGYVSEELKQPSYLRIAIQDSTNNRKAVTALVNKLQEAGYRNVTVYKKWSEPLKSSRIIAQNGDHNSAEMIQTTLGFGEVRIESTGSLSSDVTIKIGEDWSSQFGTNGDG